MKKNDLLITGITDMTSEGEGIGRVDAFPFFIKDACIGDTVSFIVTKIKNNFGYGRLKEILEPSPERTEPVCPSASACGGCQIQQMDYQAQLRFKTEKVRQNLKRIGGFEDPEVLPCLGMAHPWNYRNKAQIPVGVNKKGELVTGFYAGRTHDIIDREDCAITFPEQGDIVRIVKRWMKENGIGSYDENTGKGLVRHILIRKGFSTGEIMVCLIVNGKKLPGAEALVQLLKAIPGFTTLCLNTNMQRGNTILGKETRALYGPGFIRDRIGDVLFEISPNSFYQVNPAQTRVLYEKALEYAAPEGSETVWDLYCGIGTISLFLSGKAKKVYGVEIVPQAIEDARKNAALNHIANVEFFTGKAEEVLPEWYEAHPDETIDCIVVDPPRKGLDKTVIDTIIRMAPKRMVYVSCDSATLARDLKLLSEGGFILEKVQPVDMFPMTVSVETVVQLSKGNISSEKIRVEFNLEDMDMCRCHDKAK